MRQMKLDYEKQISAEKRINRDLRSKHGCVIDLDTVERLRKQLATQDKVLPKEVVSQEMQTDDIEEPLSPAIRVEEHKALKETEDAQIQSTQSLHSNVASDSGKVRNLLDKLKKVEDENVRLLLANKDLKLQAREQGNILATFGFMRPGKVITYFVYV